LMIEQAAAAVGPLLVMKRQLDLPWTKRLRAKVRTWRERFAQPDYVWMRWSAGLFALALAALLLVPLPHKVSANARLEGAIQRVMTAPQDGFLRQVHVRPGDTVKTGQVMAVLSDDDLQFTRRSRQAEVAQHDNAFADAFARGDRAQAAIEQARAAEAKAELALVDQQIVRTQVTAPFDGVVIQGDLSHQLGAPLKRGETLVTLSPSADFRVIMEVDEHDIGLMEQDQRARLLLSALPGQPIDMLVKRITPVARTIDGRLRYEVQANPVDVKAAAAMGLRPGLQGVAKVDQPWTPLAWRGLRYSWQQIRWAAWVWL
jgi:multidrug resistance efflux pump